jgi:hypothetical protein
MPNPPSTNIPQGPPLREPVQESVSPGYLQALMMLRQMLLNQSPPQSPSDVAPPPPSQSVPNTQQLMDMIYQRKGRD